MHATAACSALARTACLLLVIPSLVSVSLAQAAQERERRQPAPVERLGPTSLRVGTIQIDTAKKEVTIAGKVTDATTLEFVAMVKGGLKGYETALELDASAIDFNVALILAGADPARSVPPKRQFDPAIPQGDPLEITVEWTDPSGRRKIRAEQLIYNTQSKSTLPEVPWVYTGSVFVEGAKAYLAELEGSLIGFSHTQANIIDHPRQLPSPVYGADVINPALKLTPGTAVTLTIRLIPRK